jgi:hypothetical protein
MSPCSALSKPRTLQSLSFCHLGSAPVPPVRVTVAEPAEADLLCGVKKWLVPEPGKLLQKHKAVLLVVISYRRKGCVSKARVGESGHYSVITTDTRVARSRRGSTLNIRSGRRLRTRADCFLRSRTSTGAGRFTSRAPKPIEANERE